MSDYTQRIELPEVTEAQATVFATWNQALNQLDAIIDMYALDIAVNVPPLIPDSGDTYILGDAPTGAWIGQAGKIASFAVGTWLFYTPFNGLHAFLASNMTMIVYDDGDWVAVGSADFATKSGTETFSNKSISGALDIFTNGQGVSVSSGSSALAEVKALFHIVNEDASTCGVRSSCYWNGSTIDPFQNNDNSLWEVFNNVASDSLNRSWGGSFANAYNNIPAGVTDGGERTGIIGWAVSVASPTHTHAGTLQQQIGCHGVAGFQGSGSAATAIIESATGVRGYIYNDSAGATIVNARAGEFISTAQTGVVENSIAVYASAGRGTTTNYAFYGNAGKIYNKDQLLVGNLSTQSSSLICARNSGNAYEFGHPDPNGYACSFGATWSSGAPFVALCAEADPAGNTFTTRGKLGTVIWNNLAGALVFSRLTNANAVGQSLTENARFDADGHLALAATPYLATGTPASATAAGKTGELCWDANYIYVCVATNTWKRTALSSW